MNPWTDDQYEDSVIDKVESSQVDVTVEGRVGGDAPREWDYDDN